MFRPIPENEIEYLYKTFVLKSKPYLNRIRRAEDFEDYPFAAEGKLKGLDAPRAFCLLDFQTWLAKYSVPTREVLITSHEDPEIALLPSSAHLTEIRYEDGYDLHTFDLPKKDYDFMIVSQTLEHVYNPAQVMKKCWVHLRPGGYFFTSVPSINVPHNMPLNFSQFFPIGLATLALEADFDICEIGFWGCKEYLVKLFSDYVWSDIYSLGDLAADANYPVGCWALLRKPVEPIRQANS